MSPAVAPARRILFLSPAVPDPAGAGWEKRAWSHLQALSADAEVDLLLCLLPAQRGNVDGPALARARALCRRLDILPIRPTARRSTSRVPGLTLLRRLPLTRAPQYEFDTAGDADATLPAPADYDLAFCFRLRCHALLDALGRRAGLAWRRRFVDMDDVESQVLWREFLARRGDYGFERWLLILAAAAAAHRDEADALRRADGIGVCSTVDATRLAARRPRAQVAVVPNSFPALAPLPPAVPAETARLLFLGTLSFKPNEDAILYFCAEILPLLRQRCPRPFVVDIVGRAPSAAVRALGELAGVTVTAGVERVEPSYQAADVVVVPIRYGGGTRIKILEALAFGRAVVSTTIGAEGLDLRLGEDILVADDPTAFADACIRLLGDEPLRQRIAAAGRARFLDTYEAGRVQTRMMETLSSLLAG